VCRQNASSQQSQKLFFYLVKLLVY
jgi:hypothetical protein